MVTLRSVNDAVADCGPAKEGLIDMRFISRLCLTTALIASSFAMPALAGGSSEYVIRNKTQGTAAKTQGTAAPRAARQDNSKNYIIRNTEPVPEQRSQTLPMEVTNEVTIPAPAKPVTTVLQPTPKPMPVPVPLAAAPGGWRTGMYVAGAVGAAQTSTLRGTESTAGTVRYFPKNPGIAAGASVGAYVNGVDGVGPDDRWRGSITYNYIRNGIEDFSFTGTDKTGVRTRNTRYDYAGAATLHAGFLQVEYAPDLGMGDFRPYVGGGVGYGQLKLGKGVEAFKAERGVVYKGIAGVAYEIADGFELTGEYNFFYMPGLDLDGPAPETVSALRDTNYKAHTLMLGGRYSF